MQDKKSFKLVDVFNRLETVEQKSFWMVAPFSALIGIASFFIVGSYDFIWTSIVLAITCLLIPAILMVIVSKKKNYHSAYLILCLLLGAISAPLCLFFTGGFLGGNMLFCSLVTGLTALCYMPKHRIGAFITCFICNLISFFLVWNLRSPLPLSEVKNFMDLLELSGNKELISAYDKSVKAIGLDQLFTYSLSSIGLFLVLFWVTSDIKQFKTNQDALTRYFDTAKRKEIFKKAEDSDGKVLSEHKKAAILFADVSNFTSLTEKMNPDLVSEFLNDFFTMAGRHIHETGGIIDKFIGDCIMAFWSGDDKDCVSNCAKAMLDLKQEILDKSEDTYKKYGVELNFSAGIAYGDVIFGDIGSETMHDYTIIGDAVNIASRIQGYATSGEMLVSDAGAFEIKDTIVLEKTESNHFFKGKNKPTDIYRIIRYANLKQETQVDVLGDLQYELYVCGCRGSFPVSGLRFSEYGGETSCYLIKKDDYAVIIDCGTGLKNAVELVKDCKKVDILLTHVHYDHILGLLMSKFSNKIKVKIYGRFDKWNKSSKESMGFMEKPYWPIEMSFDEKITINPGEEIKLNDDICATFYESDHPDDACVIKLMCGTKKVVFLADCENATKIKKEVAKNSDLLFFDGMFDDNDKVSHKGWGHGTWQDGIRFLEGRNIKKLVITHHNPECGDHTLMLKETEARSMAQNVSFAKSGDIFHF